jgi:N-acetylmuramoyl-L-alanine amidase
MTGIFRLRTLTLLAVTLTGVASMPVRARGAQPSTSAVPPVESLFADASAKEMAVRKALAANEPLPTLLKAVRVVVADYETVVRHYPTSGFCDDALWRGAKLSRDAFEEFHDPRERTTALRLLQFLVSQYPSSKLARLAPEQITWLNGHPAKAVPVVADAAPSGPATTAGTPAKSRPAQPLTSAPTPAVARPPVAASAASAGRGAAAPSTAVATAGPLVTVKAVRRAVLKDVVRVIVELDSEVAFRDERLENPNRVFIDLPSTKIVPALLEQTLRFDADADLVRQVRIGRQPNDTTRIVLEASGVSSYSVYPLYSPFRLVIDCMRTAPAPGPSLTGSARPNDRPGASSTPSRPPVAASVAPPPPTSRSVTAPVIKPAPMTQPLASPLPPVAAPPLVARRLPWVLPLPSVGAVAFAADAAAAVPTTAPTAPLASRPTANPAATLLPAVPPPNLAGGLSMARQLGLGVSRIVIDPGHGGHDPGAKGPDMTEAELVLDVALRLEKLLAKLPGVEVVLTRRTNEFIPLQERTAIANRENADLFLSIHANASSVPAARGVETYFLNFASNQGAAAVAARENATSGQTMGALLDVVKAIALNSKLDESREFATHVQRELVDSIRPANKTVKDLGVKQAPFVVLIGAAMPSVLAEISFITNPQEAKLLTGSSYRQRIAQALFEGVREYQSSLKKVPAVAQQD